jgi:hypothetical protein
MLYKVFENKRRPKLYYRASPNSRHAKMVEQNKAKGNTDFYKLADYTSNRCCELYIFWMGSMVTKKTFVSV